VTCLNNRLIGIVEVICQLVETFIFSLSWSIDTAPMEAVWATPHGSVDPSGSMWVAEGFDVVEYGGGGVGIINFPEPVGKVQGKDKLCGGLHGECQEDRDDDVLVEIHYRAICIDEDGWLYVVVSIV
jgi:hypothetical protein